MRFIRKDARFARGFTLVELLVVLVIIGTVLSVAMLSFGLLSNDRDMRTEAIRFASLAEVVQDEGAMQGREFGIELMRDSYRFVEYDPFGEQWAAVPGDEMLRPRALPEGLEFELYLEDKRILLDDEPAEFDDPDDNSNMRVGEQYAPHLLIYSSGDSTPFDLHIWRAFDNQRVLVRGDALGGIEINPQDDD